MTLNIGLTYDNGALLLADRRATKGDRIITENYFKIYKIWDNVSATYTGPTSAINKMHDLIYASSVCDKHFKELLKGGKIKKSRAFDMADIRITPDTKLEHDPESMTLDKILVDWSGKEILPQEVFRIYNYKNQILFDIYSVAKQFYQFMNDDSDGIVAGIDIKDPRIIEITSGEFFEKSWAANQRTAEINLKNHYEEISGFDQVLELAIFCGVRCAQDYWTVNQNFNVVNITEKNGKIVSKLVSRKKIQKITEIYSNRKGAFKPISK